MSEIALLHTERIFNKNYFLKIENQGQGEDKFPFEKVNSDTRAEQRIWSLGV